MRHFLLCLLAASPALAHMVSISTGDITIEGVRARYEFRMPLYEIAHVQEPEKALRSAIRFFHSGVEATQTRFACLNDARENALICRAEYQFSQPVDILEARSSFHSITVPNHVHLLRALMGDKSDQAVLDLSFPKAELRFRPPTLLERAIQQSLAGALRAIGGAAQWLFLAALVLAARSRREFLLLTVMFLASELLTVSLLPFSSWRPAPRFVEAAAALTIAYLAVEICLLPAAGKRWAVVAVLGLFHGLYFLLFIESSDYSPAWVMLGVVAAELLLIALLAWLFARLTRPLAALQPVRALSVILLFIGLGWFFLRLQN